MQAELPAPGARRPASPFPVRRRPDFIKQFEGSGVLCFKFWELVAAWGCPFRCAYCFLQTVPYARFNREALTGMIYANWRHMLNQVEEWLTARTPRMLVVGELQDGLVFDNAYAQATGRPLTHHLIPLFAAQSRHRLIFLTKSTLIKNALRLAPTPQVVFSWSVNAEYPARQWELGTPSPNGRFAAARRMQEAGWPIRFRLDPMIPYETDTENWRDGYARAIEQINALRPEMVTLGALRASNKTSLRREAMRNGRPDDVFNYLTEDQDASGFKYRIPFEQQVEMYRFALKRLDRTRVVPALCKEDRTVWEAVGLPFNGCHCLLGGTVPAELAPWPNCRRPLPTV
jgi:spore photoproduct lyase